MTIIPITKARAESDFLSIPDMKESIQEGMEESVDECADTVDL